MGFRSFICAAMFSLASHFIQQQLDSKLNSGLREKLTAYYSSRLM